MSGIFVTGTDTDCGKTQVACALARALRGAGLRPAALKPVETGCEARGGELLPADALALASACGDTAPLERLCPYRLSLPAAPQAAAEFEGIEIDLTRIDRAFHAAAKASDLVLVEGAGGLRVPIRPGFDMASLAARLELPLLVVVRAALGTLNHTLLTLEAAAARGLDVLGVVVSHTQPELPDASLRNLELLRRELPVPELAELRHGATELTPALDVAALLSQLGGS